MEPELGSFLRPFFTLVLDVQHQPPKTSNSQSGPTSAGFIDYSCFHENQTPMPYMEFAKNKEENASSYFQKFEGKLKFKFPQELYDRNTDKSCF